MQDFAVTGQLTFDPPGTDLFALASVLFLVLRAKKKLGLLADPRQ